MPGLEDAKYDRYLKEFIMYVESTSAMKFKVEFLNTRSVAICFKPNIFMWLFNTMCLLTDSSTP